jgi:hypothetical protein|tara:strand:- start:960 stop:1226 length:267 start_codon:yes stop_codon:yes gene_type:complete
MKLLNGLSSNKYITINDEKRTKKFISNFDKYENKIELLPDYNTEEELRKFKSISNRYQKAYNLFMESWDTLPRENQSYLTAKLEELGL